MTITIDPALMTLFVLAVFAFFIVGASIVIYDWLRKK
jgi:hypothetical protein